MPIRQDQIPDPIAPALRSAFDRTVTADRWRTYQIAAGFDEDRAHRLYLWNAAVGQGFHFPMQAVEVALRNVIHQALTTNYGPDWWEASNFRAVVKRAPQDDIQKAVRRYRRKYGTDPTTAQIVASLSLGFWIILLARDYNVSLWNDHARTTFPHLSAEETMSAVSQTGRTIQDLRNRIFHQEPLIGRNLTADYAAILRMLGWICQDTRAWVRRYSSVPRVIRMRL